MRVMIVEDDPISRHLLETFLGELGYEILSTCDGLEAWEIMQEPEAPSLVISDWMMPAMDGLELCERIRRMDKPDYTYFILLTAKGDKKDVIKGLESGADDFITKPFDRGELKFRVKIGERIINLEHRITQLANTDFLTGALNRRAFMARMEEEISRSIREDKEFSLILTDIDHFKKVNDTHGHQVGDLVLQKFSTELSENMRPYDFVGRYGGEEFIACLPGINMEQAGLTAERMRLNVESIQFSFPDNRSLPVQITASFGVASFKPMSHESLDSIIKRADDALYRAKSEGRNRVCRSVDFVPVNKDQDSLRTSNERSD